MIRNIISLGNLFSPQKRMMCKVDYFMIPRSKSFGLSTGAESASSMYRFRQHERAEAIKTLNVRDPLYYPTTSSYQETTSTQQYET